MACVTLIFIYLKIIASAADLFLLHASVGRSGGARAQGSGCKMPMFMSVLYGRSRIDCGFDATQDSNLEFRIADSRAWIAKSEFSGSIGNSCIVKHPVEKVVPKYQESTEDP